MSRAITLVTDIHSGYFARFSLTPVNRLALLLGLMVADFMLVVALAIPVVVIGFVVGVRFESGVLGLIAFVLIAGVWGVAVAGYLYSIALKAGKPTAVNSSWRGNVSVLSNLKVGGDADGFATTVTMKHRAARTPATPPYLTSFSFHLHPPFHLSTLDSPVLRVMGTEEARTGRLCVVFLQSTP